MGFELHELKLVDQINQRIEISKDVHTLWWYGNRKFDLASMEWPYASKMMGLINGLAAPLAPWHLRGVSIKNQINT